MSEEMDEPRRVLPVCKLVVTCLVLFTCYGLFWSWWYSRHDKAIGTDTVIGIDLGTTYSRVGIYKDGRVEILVNDQRNRNTPSCVAFTSNNERLVGDEAKHQMVSNPANTIFDVKRFIGRSWNEESVQQDIKLYPFKVINKNNKPHIGVQTADGEKIFAPEEISAMVLRKMKKIAEQYLGKKINKAVVTVPAYFNFAQRQATVDAGKIAGLDVIRILNEPTAAALAHRLYKKDSIKNIVIFDLGSGTLDVSVLTISHGSFEVLATNGNPHLGGEDFDLRVMDYFIKLYKKKGKDITKNSRAVQKLRREVERAKRALSSDHEVTLNIDSLFENEDFMEVLTRSRFEELNDDLFKSILKPLAQVFNDLDLQKEEIDEVVLVGGSTQIPKVQQLIRKFFNGKKLSQTINPDEAVASGAAVLAGVLGGEEDIGDVVLLDVNPFTISVRAINVDMTKLTKLIPRNTIIPTEKSHIFSTVAKEQPTVTISVYEGERPTAKDNHLLGKFHVTDIPPAHKGVREIEVTFEIDVNGILKVRAKTKGSGSKNLFVLQGAQEGDPKDFGHMVTDAEKYAEEDKKIKERVDAKNELESYAYSLKNQISDKEKLGAKLGEDDKEKITEAVESTIKWLESNHDADAGQLKEKKMELEGVVQPIITKLYRQLDGAPPPTGDDNVSKKVEL